MSSQHSDAGQEAAGHLDLEEAAKDESDNYDPLPPQSLTASPTKCSICQSTFRRPEHLKRHFRSHTKEKPFECAQCGRHFSRTDTLHRHELSHHNAGREGGKDRTHRITVKTFRACYKCALARVRCSGGTPCARCENRSLECQYPTERRSKAKARREAAQSALGRDEEFNGQSFLTVASTSVDGSAVRSPPVGEGSLTKPLQYRMTQFQLQLPGAGLLNGDAPSSPAVSEAFAHSEALKKLSKETPQNTGQNINATDQSKRLDNQMPSIDISDVAQSTSHEPFSANSQTKEQRRSSSAIENLHLLKRITEPVGSPSGVRPMLARHGRHASTTTNGDQRGEHGSIEPFLDTVDSTVPAMNWLPGEAPYGTFTGRTPTANHAGHEARDGYMKYSAWFPPVIHPVNGGHEHMLGSPVAHTSLKSNRNSPGRTGRLTFSSSTSRPADLVEDRASRPPTYRHQQDIWLNCSALSPNGHFAGGGENTPRRFLFPNIEDTTMHDIPIGTSLLIGPSTYEKIHKAFVQLCCTESVLFSPFESEYFPSANVLSDFVRLYFHHFQPVYPMFHLPLFDANTCHWVVTLALAAIGSHYARLHESDECVSAFHELLRRVIMVEKENPCLEQTSLWLVQAKLLDCIGLMYNSDERARDSALDRFGDLTSLLIRNQLLKPSGHNKSDFRDKPVEQKWLIWVEDEVRRRTAYLVWLVDCTVAYHFDKQPFFSLEDGQAALPSHERLWQAESADIWQGLLDRNPGQSELSLYDAVLIMYIEKRLVPGLGGLSHILLIHALYQRMWEVGDYFRRPLSFWNPTAEKQSRLTAIPSGSVWLPGIPSYSKWRNSACDSLDILHWAANSTATTAADLRNPTILHLHSARIVLLAPFREIRSLAHSLVTEKFRWSERQQSLEWHFILRWVRHDQYKARLAIIHAGATLLHARGNTSHAFHEPVAVFLATLVLWAYGCCHAQLADRVRPDPSQEPTVIHLDQPCDDELVQLFVREGHAIQGVLTGVGDICAAQGPAGVLRAGSETFVDLMSWGISRKLKSILSQLADIVNPV
ncbi:putative C2H2 transcription factor [Aspergillus saccharolyticus JOP 1030-1]|uniref:C2H2 transcription factor n=1 Tax=Aspergillus saccharolyticus JOP 1030-1 TaxID=1450539 RepID=A0A318ZJ60_9EURO|nr:hypothetical protein BP01DRAFT_357597 [Aspergillus saccharolyticus JOP 1030-1]PYH44603.1 hypothetical protein BP01DRAFT_357597 [Aspergillus saccharolyticus JOP 1030-1]